MPRRRHHKSKGKGKQLAFRIGNIAAGGGKPFVMNSRTVNCVCAGQLRVSVTSAGDTAAFSLTSYSQPADPVATTTFSIAGTANNHPSEHVTAILLGYDRTRVVSALYRFDVRFVGVNSASKDFVFAYKFGMDSAAALLLTAGDVTVDGWKDMRQSKAWVWKRFSAINAGGSMYPSQGRVEVRIPSIYRLGEALSKSIRSTATAIEDYTAVLDDSGANVAAIIPLLHIVVMTIDGTAFLAGDVVVDVTVFQRVKFEKKTDTADMIDEADQTS